VNPSNLLPALAGAINPVLAFFVLVLAIDIGLGVIRSLAASLQTRRLGAVPTSVKGFDWSYLGSFAKTQLLSPPVVALAGALYLAVQVPGATKDSILAIATSAAFAQSLILSRDIVAKCRELAALILAKTPAPAAAPKPA